jgi:hypothetical protein
VRDDIRTLQDGVHVVVGTPGRVYDMIQRRVLRTKALRTLVLDEADEMLTRGFRDQIYDVYRHLPPATQVVLVSATLPAEILDMTRKFMNAPVRVLVKRDELTLEGCISMNAALRGANPRAEEQASDELSLTDSMSRLACEPLLTSVQLRVSRGSFFPRPKPASPTVYSASDGVTLSLHAAWMSLAMKRTGQELYGADLEEVGAEEAAEEEPRGDAPLLQLGNRNEEPEPAALPAELLLERLLGALVFESTRLHCRRCDDVIESSAGNSSFGSPICASGSVRADISDTADVLISNMAAN